MLNFVLVYFLFSVLYIVLRETVFYHAKRNRTYNHKKIEKTKDNNLWKKIFNYRSRRYVSKFMWTINLCYIYMSIVIALILLVLMIVSLFNDINYFDLFLNGLFKLYAAIFVIIIIFYAYSEPVNRKK